MIYDLFLRCPLFSTLPKPFSKKLPDVIVGRVARGGIVFVFLWSFAIWPLCLLAQKHQAKEWHDAIGRQGISSAEEEDLAYLDSISFEKKWPMECAARVVGIIEHTSSIDVVCKALATISNLSYIPNSLLRATENLRDSKNTAILVQLSSFFGKIAQPRIVMTAISLLTIRECVNNIVLSMHRFGIFSLSFLIEMQGIIADIEIRKQIPYILQDFVHSIPQILLSVTCNGLGFIIPYRVFGRNDRIFSDLEPSIVLPQIKQLLGRMGFGR